MYLWASTAQRYFNMDNKLQALLTLLSLLAAVVQLNSAFNHHTTTAHIIQRTATVPVFSSAISPTLIGQLYYNSIVVVPEESEKILHVGPDWPEQKCVSTCGGNDNNAGARGRFHKADLHFVLMLSNEGRLQKTTDWFWINLTSCFCRSDSLSSSSWSRLTLHQNTAHRARRDGVYHRWVLSQVWELLTAHTSK